MINLLLGMVMGALLLVVGGRTARRWARHRAERDITGFLEEQFLTKPEWQVEYEKKVSAR